MNTETYTNSENKLNTFGKKSSFGQDGSYRIFHITKKQNEESDDDENFYNKNEEIIDKVNDIKSKCQKKSFKISNRNGLDGWKRKSTKNKRLLFLHKTSCESTSNEIKTPPSSHYLASDLSQSIISNNAPASRQLLPKNKQHGEREDLDELSDSDALVEAVDQTMNHDDATLNDLLARANQLETTVKTQEFNKIQPIGRTNFQRRRKRFMIACGTVLLILTIIIAVIIFVVVMTIKYKTKTNQTPKFPSIYDGYR